MVRGALFATEVTDDVTEQLPDARRFHAETGSNHPQARRPRLQDGARTVRTDHLVVSHINDEQVRLAGGAVAGDLQGHVRVDRRHRPVHDLELHARILLAKHDAEDLTKVERRIRRAHGSRPAEDEDPDLPGGLGGENARLRAASQRAGEETPSEAVVRRTRAVGIRPQEEARGITIASQPQTGFQEHEEQDWGEETQRQPQEPSSPPAKTARFAGRIGGCTEPGLAASASLCPAFPETLCWSATADTAPTWRGISPLTIRLFSLNLRHMRLPQCLA